MARQLKVLAKAVPAMTLTVNCPNGHVLKVKDECAGKTGRCPHCQAQVTVPLRQGLSDDNVMGFMERPRPPQPPRDAGRTAACRYGRGIREHSSGGEGPPVTTPARQAPAEAAHGFTILRRKKSCPQCDNRVSFAFTICPRCGTPLAHIPILSPRSDAIG